MIGVFRMKPKIDNSGGPRLFIIWDELVRQVRTLDKEVTRNVNGANLSAGIRIRKQLKSIIKQAKYLSEESLKNDKLIFKKRKQKRITELQEKKI